MTSNHILKKHKEDKTHQHHHHHHYGDNIQGKKLLIVILLNFIITVVEIIGGILSNSLSLISDAIHNLGDTMGLVLAYIANKISKRQADMKYTFGYKRAEILAAFINAIILIIICLFLFKEAYERYMNPAPIKGLLMFGVAIIGLIANWISVLLLQKDKNKNINIRAAYLHLMGDTLSSIAVIIGGIAIWIFNISWIDPLITILISIYIIYHTWNILQQSIDILMQGVPKNININSIIIAMQQIPYISNVHHLHIWQLNENQIHLEAHINIKENIDMKQMMLVREQTIKLLKEEFAINHVTLQMGYNCCNGSQDIINIP